MKAVCDSLGVARSNVHARLNRTDTWKDGRKGRTSSEDKLLIEELKVEIAALPSYGYRRAVALVNRQRQAMGNARVNHKRGYRVMKAAGLLLPKAPRRARSSRPHDGTVAVDRSDARWCSDGFEIRCDSGDTVTATFTKDCCDREILAWRAWPGRGLPGEPVREMLIEAVEKRFGSTEGLPVVIVWSSSATTVGPTSPLTRRRSPASWGCNPSTRPCAARRATAWPRAS